MSAEEAVRPRLRKPSREEYRALHLFAAGQGIELESFTHNPMVLEVPNARYYDVFDVPVPVARVLGRLGSIYAAGYYIGYIEGYRFNPSLPLAHRLSRLCGHLIKCSRVSWSGEKFFLYGRRVMGDNIVEWSPGLRIVVNPLGEALGWGVGIVEGGVRVIEPFKDLGWYLRRGG